MLSQCLNTGSTTINLRKEMGTSLKDKTLRGQLWAGALASRSLQLTVYYSK